MAYDQPTADEFAARFPEFEDIDDDLLAACLAEASRQVDESWLEADFKTAILYYTAHLMQTSEGAYDSGGLKSFSVGPISVTFGDAKGNIDLTATSYGQNYLQLLRQNRGGPRVI